MADENNELSPEEQAKLEAEANQPSKDKYENMAKAINKKGKNKKPLISKGRNYEITLNEK